MASSNATRFLNAFTQLESLFKRMNQTEQTRNFTAYVHYYAKNNEVVKMYRDDLLQIAQLRNAIVHERVEGDEVIAEPHLDLVEKLESILALLSKPKTIKDLKLRELLTCQIDDWFMDVISRMEKYGYTQVPVLKGVRVVNVLSTTHVLHFIQDNINEGIVDFAGIKVADVLEASTKHYELVYEDKPLIEVVNLFNQRIQEGNRLTCLVILNNKSSTNGPVGVLTLKDMPKILDIILGV